MSNSYLSKPFVKDFLRDMFLHNYGAMLLNVNTEGWLQGVEGEIRLWEQG